MVFSRYSPKIFNKYYFIVKQNLSNCTLFALMIYNLTFKLYIILYKIANKFDMFINNKSIIVAFYPRNQN